MNCLIKTLQLEGGWYTVYVHPRQRWQMKKCRCPQCGETWQILVPQLKYRIYRIERRTDIIRQPGIFRDRFSRSRTETHFCICLAENRSGFLSWQIGIRREWTGYLSGKECLCVSVDSWRRKRSAVKRSAVLVVKSSATGQNNIFWWSRRERF